jgi:hypothetical protein
MLSGDEIQANLTGAWRLMTGKQDGLRLFDISADGFWNSFFAIAVALPALAVGWVAISNEIGGDGSPGTRLGIVAALAVVDLGAWVIPLAGLAFVARPAGIADRFVHYVIATNWASAIIVWMMLPPALLRLVVPSAGSFSSLLSLALFGLTMVLTWRLTIAVIAKGAAIGTAVFACMFLASLAVLFGLQALLGLSAPTPG